MSPDREPSAIEHDDFEEEEEAEVVPPLTPEEQAQWAKIYDVNIPTNDAEEAIFNLTETLARDEKILSMIQLVKSEILVGGAPEIGSADYNDMVDSLRSAGHDNPESLARKLINGDIDNTVEGGYQREIKERKDLISKHQQSL